MGKGFVAGAVFGLVVSAIALTLASLSLPQPAGVAPPASPTTQAPEAATAGDGPAPGRAIETVEPARSGGPPPGAPSPAPPLPRAEVAGLGGADPAPVPDVGAAPVAGARAPVQVPQPEAPSAEPGGPAARSVGPASLPSVGPADAPAEAPDPTALPVPTPQTETTGPQPPEQTGSGQTPSLDIALADGPPRGRDGQVAPDAPGGGAAPASAQLPDAAPGQPAAPGIGLQQPDAASAPLIVESGAVSELPTPPAAIAADPLVPDTAPVAVASPIPAEADPPGANPAPDGPRVALQGAQMPGGDGGVVVNRPDDDALVADEASSEVVPEVPETADAGADDRPALERFAAPFERGDPALPLVSVVLIDEGTLPSAPVALAALDLPVTVAIDPGAADAATRAAAFRAAGFEIAMAPSLATGATPQDVEVTLEAVGRGLASAVALVDPGGAWQSSRAVADQTVARLSEEGLGMALTANGLNPGARAAEAAGLPARIIFRDLDGAGQDAGAIRRLLDQAALRARQEGDVVLLGRVRPDTISALALWKNGRSAGEVALAPLSAVLLSVPAEAGADEG